MKCFGIDINKLSAGFDTCRTFYFLKNIFETSCFFFQVGATEFSLIEVMSVHLLPRH